VTGRCPGLAQYLEEEVMPLLDVAAAAASADTVPGAEEEDCKPTRALVPSAGLAWNLRYAGEGAEALETEYVRARVWLWPIAIKIELIYAPHVLAMRLRGGAALIDLASFAVSVMVALTLWSRPAGSVGPGLRLGYRGVARALGRLTLFPQMLQSVSAGGSVPPLFSLALFLLSRLIGALTMFYGGFLPFKLCLPVEAALQSYSLYALAGRRASLSPAMALMTSPSTASYPSRRSSGSTGWSGGSARGSWQRGGGPARGASATAAEVALAESPRPRDRRCEIGADPGDRPLPIALAISWPPFPHLWAPLRPAPP
jgi:hypothetical protein